MKPSRTLLVALAALAAAPALAQPRTPPPTTRLVPRGGGMSASPGTYTDARCVVRRGCPAVTALPRCAAGLTPSRFDEVFDNRLTLAGRAVTFRAVLVPSSGCTEMGCADGTCCNHCQGAVALAPAEREHRRSIALVAGEVRDGSPYRCAGDDSAVCCGVSLEQRSVVARGTLQLVPRSGGTYQLVNPTLCVP